MQQRARQSFQAKPHRGWAHHQPNHFSYQRLACAEQRRYVTRRRLATRVICNVMMLYAIPPCHDAICNATCHDIRRDAVCNANMTWCYMQSKNAMMPRAYHGAISNAITSRVRHNIMRMLCYPVHTMAPYAARRCHELKP